MSDVELWGRACTNRLMGRIINMVPQTRRKLRQSKPGVAPGRTGGPGGQLPFVPTEAQRLQVMTYVAAGFTHDSIALLMSIPSTTLERHFDFELKHGKVVIDGKVLGGIVNQAIEGDKTMRIFYAKARAGWRDGGPSADALPATLFSISIGGSPSDSAAEISVQTIAGRITNGEDKDEEP